MPRVLDPQAYLLPLGSGEPIRLTRHATAVSSHVAAERRLKSYDGGEVLHAIERVLVPKGLRLGR